MNRTEKLNKKLAQVKTEIYDPLSFEMANVENEAEGKAYDACQFELNGMKIISRSSKITPKKTGQFVTFWKRNRAGITAPYAENDPFYFYVIQLRSGDRFGQFVFPKSELRTKGFITSTKKDGKRGFRVYPPWEKTLNKQAEKTQNWQLNYFYELNETTDLERVKALYNGK